MKALFIPVLTLVFSCWPFLSLGATFGLISPQNLKTELTGQKIIILDSRPETKYLKGHIPGSLDFSWEKFTYTDPKGIKYRLISPHKLVKVLGKIGISEESTVVAYGDADSSWGGEGWILWVLDYLGHKGRLLLLNGGINAWLKAGFPLKSGREECHRPAKYSLQLRPEVNCDSQWIKKHSGSINIVDTRSLPEYLLGRIPGSIHIRWKDFLKRNNIRSEKEISALLKGRGLDLKKTTVYYCTGGIRSGFAYTIHKIFDLGPVRNFEGGTEEWVKKSKPSR